MKAYQNILAVVNKASNYSHTVAKAYQLAQQSHGSVTFLALNSHFEKVNSVNKQQKLKAEQLSINLADTITKQNKHGLLLQIKQVSTLQEYRAIAHELEGHAYDLVIKEKQAHQPFTLGFSLAKDWPLLRCANAPVLLVTDKHWQDHGHVLTALETEELTSAHQLFNKELLSHTCQLSDLLSCDIHLLNCYFGGRTSMAINGVNDSNKQKGDKRQHWQHLVALSKEIPLLDKSIDKKLHIKQGLPDEVIPEIASQYKVNMVVIGSGEHKNIFNNMLGHTSEYVIDKLACDVLAISPNVKHYH